jgi:hypothetical protein
LVVVLVGDLDNGEVRRLLLLPAVVDNDLKRARSLPLRRSLATRTTKLKAGVASRVVGKVVLVVDGRIFDDQLRTGVEALFGGSVLQGFAGGEDGAWVERGGGRRNGVKVEGWKEGGRGGLRFRSGGKSIVGRSGRG